MKQIIIILILFAGVLQLHAVFEGRDENLQEYTTIRNNVTIESHGNEQKATGINPKDDRNIYNATNGTPVSDTPLLFLFFSGLSYGIFIYRKKKSLSNE